MKIRLTIFVFSLLFVSGIFAQEKKSINIKKATNPPKIDGVLDDDIWQDAEEAKDFVQFRPAMGVLEKEHQKTIVKMTYDDNAVYVGAYLYDKPEDIMKQVTSRDNFGASDFFGIVINPNNDGQNDTEFFVFPTGNQADAIVSPGSNEDFGWNAVWDSSVNIVDDGWIVEVKIPYSALRFSNQKIQTWGVQFHRRFRTDESQYTWNPIDRTQGYFGSYSGEVTGIQDITPPTRLSFYPFTSFLTRSFDGENDSDFSFGMDVKYGITENFTLDATLVPDFSQAGFDNVELNLGPFEQQFSEQRQFFTEGVDLFSKGDLFYSRRIGNAPTGSPDLNSEEYISEYPNKVKMLNAVKVSGRTKKGIGIGFFNAITEKTYATITNSLTDDSRKEVVEPLSNYNILVIDKQFGENSSVSFINTNVTRGGHFRDANVTGAMFDITDKNKKFNYEGEIKMSHINNIDEDQTGFSAQAGFNKVSGKYRFGIDYSMADKKYDINDLGIQFRNNFSNYSLYANYRIFEPTEKLNSFNVNFWANYNMLYKPSTYTGKNAGVNVYMQNKKLWEFGGNINFRFGKQYDYFEPRTEGRFFAFKNNFNFNTWFGTNYAKPFAMSAYSGLATHFNKDRDVFYHFLGIDPRLRFNDKFTLSYSFNYERGRGGQGFVTNIDDDIVFGQRRQLTIENSISGSFNFNSFHALRLTFRNYLSTVTYDNELLILQDDGSTIQGYTLDDVSDPNLRFNTWNLDFSYSWQFAPGSQLTALYRNSLFNVDNNSLVPYFDSVGDLFEEPIEHVFSLRLVYYIDYNNVKSLFRKKSS